MLQIQQVHIQQLSSGAGRATRVIITQQQLFTVYRSNVGLCLEANVTSLNLLVVISSRSEVY
jgi:hypothetical protein